jgi:hypothetical protein
VVRVAPNKGLMKLLERLLKLMKRANIVPSMFLGIILACMTRVGMTTRAWNRISPPTSVNRQNSLSFIQNTSQVTRVTKPRLRTTKLIMRNWAASIIFG